MRKNRIRLYWLLLLSILLTTAVVMSHGVTQARYNNTVTTVAIVKAPTMNITSNCLVTKEDAPRTVLLGEIDTEDTMIVPFWLLSNDIDQTVKLNWGVSDAAYADYFRIGIQIGNELIEPGEEIEVLKDVQLELKLSLALTEKGRSAYHQGEIVKIHVTVNDAMWGTFQVNLPNLFGYGSVSGNQSISGNAGVSDNEMVSGNQSVSGNLSVSGNHLVPDEEQEALMGLQAVNAIHTKGQMPLLMTLADHITSVCFGVQTKQDDEILLEALPDYTMFSADGGAHYYMVYGDLLPELLLQEVTYLPLLLDFQYAKTDPDTQLTFAMEAYMGSQLRKICTATTKASAFENWETVLLEETAGEGSIQLLAVSEDDAEEIETEEESASTGKQAKLVMPILTFENKLDFPFPVEWEEADLEYSVEYLTMTEDQTLEYIPVELSEDGLQATYYEEEDDHRLELRLGRKFTSPGTYRIKISWYYEGLCYDTTQTTFFINCSGRENANAGSLEVPK